MDLNHIFTFKEAAHNSKEIKEEMSKYFNGNIVPDENVSIQDLSWLIVDNDKYNEEHMMPSSDLYNNSVQLLEEQWNAYRKNRYENNSKHNERLMDTSVRDLKTTGKKANLVKSSDVVKYAKQLLNEMKSLEQIDQSLTAAFSQDVLASAQVELEELLDSYGLLGNVYVDLSPYGSCFTSNCSTARKNIKQNNKTATFVKKTKDCSKCKFALDANSFCSDLKMEIADNIPYNRISSYYLDELEYNNRIPSGLKNSLLKSKLSHKERLRLAFLHKEPKLVQIGGVKGEVMKQPPLKFATAIVKDPIREQILKAMNTGKYGIALTDYINKNVPGNEKYKSIIAECRSEEGLLGVIYADPDLFESCEHMKNSWKVSGLEPKILLMNPNSVNTGCDHTSGVCLKTGKPLASGLQYEWEGVASIIDDLVVNGKISAEVARNIVSSVEDPKLALQQAILSQDVVKETKQSGVKVKLHDMNRDHLKDTKVSNLENIVERVAKDLRNKIDADKIKTVLAKSFNKSKVEDIIKTAMYKNKSLNASNSHKIPVNKTASRYDNIKPFTDINDFGLNGDLTFELNPIINSKEIVQIEELGKFDIEM